MTMTFTEMQKTGTNWWNYWWFFQKKKNLQLNRHSSWCFSAVCLHSKAQYGGNQHRTLQDCWPSKQTITERMTSFTEATWRGLKRVLVLTNEDHRGNLFVRNIATITCCSSLSGLSWIWGMSAMEAASHCSMLLSWGSRVTCLGPLPGSLTSEFAMTSTVLGVCTWVLSTQSVPAAQRKKIHSAVSHTFSVF